MPITDTDRVLAALRYRFSAHDQTQVTLGLRRNNKWYALAGCVFVALAGLSACAPTSPRFGNYGGTPGSQPSAGNLPADVCAVAQPQAICWTPVQARFHPDGQRMVVNLCSNRMGTPQDQYRGGIYYCRMVEYRLDDQSWHLIAGQEEDKSYLYPSYSHDGKTLVFGVDDCQRPYCIGGMGYGQLATMSVQAESGQPARYGAIKRWPVMGMSRPSFTDDDQRVLYWRNHHSARLASGRSIGSISVFEYRFANDEETHPIASLYTKQKTIRFIHAWTSPQYSLDGKVLRFSGRVDNLIASPDRVWILGGKPDLEYRGPNTDLIHRQTDRNLEGLGRVFAEHPRRGILAGPGNLRLVDPRTLQTIRVLVQPQSARVDQGDIDPSGRWALAVVGGRNLQTSGQSKQRDYWKQIRDTRKAEGMKDDVPVLPLIDLKSGQVQALRWPNIESLSIPPQK